MGLKVNQSQNNLLPYPYVDISTQGLIAYWVTCLFLWNCILLVFPIVKDFIYNIHVYVYMYTYIYIYIYISFFSIYTCNCIIF